MSTTVTPPSPSTHSAIASLKVALLTEIRNISSELVMQWVWQEGEYAMAEMVIPLGPMVSRITLRSCDENESAYACNSHHLRKGFNQSTHYPLFDCAMPPSSSLCYPYFSFHSLSYPTNLFTRIQRPIMANVILQLECIV